VPLVSRQLVIAALSALPVLLAGCPSIDYPTCSSVPVSHPNGKCSAYYYQTDYGSGGVTTQAMTDCLINSQRLGGNVVAFHTLEHGIGLRWTGPNTLEVSVPDGVKLDSQRTSDVYLGYPLSYQYRRLSPDSPEYKGCAPKRQSGGT
jgi:hypothetical protein